MERPLFLEPLFYTFLEKWLQIKWSSEITLIRNSMTHKLGALDYRCYWQEQHGGDSAVVLKHFMLLCYYYIRIVLVGNDSESDIHCWKSYITTF